jgi:chaperonin GroEL (HSP60 family)
MYMFIYIYMYSYSNTHDNYHDHSEFGQDLLDIARTTLSSKLLNVEKDHFARLAVDAVLRYVCICVCMCVCMYICMFA